MEELDKKTWNDFVNSNKFSHVLQSWQWGELQKKRNNKIWRLALAGQRDLTAGALVIKHPLPGGRNYLYIPRGPILPKEAKARTHTLKLLLDKITKIAEEEGSVFLRMDPSWTALPQNGFSQIGWREAPNQIQAKNTAILNLGKPEEELLTGMHHKARYNIRLAKRKGVQIVKTSGIDMVEDFNRLNQKTTARDHFKAHPASHYRQIMDILGSDNMALMWAAKLDGKVIAAIITTYFGRQAVYLHGVSDYEHRKVMAPHLLQWAAITEAKRRGLKEYDFNGVAPKDDPKHSWAGITRFKLSFGAQRVNFIGGQDLPYKKFWYKMFCWAKKVRR